LKVATSTVKSEIANQHGVSPSRLIPGARASVAGVPRKKSASATVDGRYWAGQDEPSLRNSKKPKLSGLADVVLPNLLVDNQRQNLTRRVGTDFVLIVFSFALAGNLTALMQFTLGHGHTALLQPTWGPAAPGSLVLYGALFILLGVSERLYHPETVQLPRREQLVLGKVTFWSALVVIAAVRWSSPPMVTTLAVGAPVSFLILLAWRNWRRFSLQPAQAGRDVRNVLIVGAGPLGRKLATQISGNRAYQRVVMGFLDESEPVGGDIHGRVADLPLIARTAFVDEIILTTPQQPDVARRVIRDARRNQIDLRVVPDLFGFEPDDPLVLEQFGDIPVLTLREESMPTFGLVVKRVVDAAIAGTALVLVAPLMILIAIAIKLESPGPVFYRAQRVGLKGRRFRCYKFRTMSADADRIKEYLRARNERQGPFFKITSDPRITRIGKWLRRYSLDELPQFWNVMRGEMSMVGPRPHPLDDFERYDLYDLQRLGVLPGLTGLWQITARDDPSFERGLALDLEYIRNWTLWQDFRILYQTIAVVLHGKGV
jgi:exopolysaccharide biosynthesis polyprenyl glycosylphosphotransferase